MAQPPLHPQEINPYAAPTVYTQEQGYVLPPERFHEVNVQVISVNRTFGERHLMLAGTTGGHLYYRAWGVGERVFMDGNLRAKTSGLTWGFNTVSSPVQFTLEGPGYLIPAQIDVFALFLILRFQLTIAGKILYNE